MRIGITCYPSYGGSGVLATELGKQLAQRGHSVHFVTYDMPVRLAGYVPGLSYHEVEVPTYPLFKYPPYLLALTNKMVEIARFGELDILHAHYAIPHATSAVLAREVFGPGAPKVVTTLHGTDVSLLAADPGFFEVLTWSLNQSDGITAVSNSLALQTQRELSLKRDIQVIHNFIDTSIYQRRPCQQLRQSLCASEVLVGHVSNFRAVKRPTDVVEFFAGIAKHVNARLILVGEGPELGRVRDLAHQRGVADRVQFLGHQDQVAEILSCLDLFVLPSEQESFGLAALEAMACGTPVLAYQVGGLAEVVTDGVGGYLLPFGDVAGLIEQGLRLLGDRVAWRAVSEAGVERAHREFSAQSIVPQYEEYYARVLEQDRS